MDLFRRALFRNKILKSKKNSLHHGYSFEIVNFALWIGVLKFWIAYFFAIYH
jgi:hypothetical protein